MTAKEYLEHGSTIWKKIDDENLTKIAMIEFAQNYHESEVKNLGLFSVSQQRELLFAFCTYLEETTNIKPFIYKDRIVNSFIEGK